MVAPPKPALAIVIPAHRLRHFEESLRSIAAQTDRRFRVYIGDDASPEPLEPVVDRFRSSLDIHYTRFAENLGGHDLVAQWQRCILLTKGEPWLWLFSDDDLMESRCVAEFHRTLEQDGAPAVDLFRFQLQFVNQHTARTHRPADHPAFERPEDLLAALLTDRRRAWRAQDHIFSRRIYDQTGGFVSFPQAIYSDFATWLQFAKQGVRTIPSARVLWRSHPTGISSGLRKSNRTEWLTAAALYTTWLEEFSRQRGPPAERIFHAAGQAYYFRELSLFRPMLTRIERRRAVDLVQRLFQCTRLSASVSLWAALARQSSALVWRRLRSRLRS